jgi:imidazolonepropionase-like amidohydrolase
VLGDAPSRVRLAFVRLMELVRHGFPRDAALLGVTVVPSKALGVEASVGTLETGKKANLLLFSGDPLDPASELRSVWLEGQKVSDDAAAR